jgi:hypothetical protein
MIPIIKYRDFYDVPRVFFVRYDDRLLLFESTFEDELDDYSTEYDVYLVPELSDSEMNRSWERISRFAARKLGRIPVNAIAFDPTRREYIDDEKLELPCGWLQERQNCADSIDR